MSFFGTGNRTINAGTTAVISNPDSNVLAEIDCNDTNAHIRSGGEPWQVTWIVGCQTTLAAFRLEQTLSTGPDMSTAGRDLTIVMVSSGQSAQFVTKHNVLPGDRFRIRMNSTITGGVSAKLIAEPLL